MKFFIFRPPSRPQYPSQPMPQQFPPNSGAPSGFPPSSAAPSGSSTGGFPPTPTSPVQNLASRLGNYSLNQVKKFQNLFLLLFFHRHPSGWWRFPDMPLPVSSNCATAPLASWGGSRWWLCYSVCIGVVVWSSCSVELSDSYLGMSLASSGKFV